jgi:transcription termination factor Rho
MTKSELESKSLADLHVLAAEAGVAKYRMLSRGELVEQLSGGEGSSEGGREQRSPQQRERPPRRRRERRPPRERKREPAEKAPAEDAPAEEAAAEEPPTPQPAAPPPAPAAAEPAPKRRRRRRRFGRRGSKEATLQSLLLPPEAGRQAVLAAESRAACTAMLRGLASDLSSESKGPDPVALLVDPTPEELAEWRREAPKAEIVAAGQARHATDALAQAKARAAAGDDVILLVDSLTRLAEAYGDADEAKDFFDAGRVQGAAGGGSLTVVAALERA